MLLELVDLVLKVSYSHLAISVLACLRLALGAIEVVLHVALIGDDLVTLGGVLTKERFLVQCVHDEAVDLAILGAPAPLGAWQVKAGKASLAVQGAAALAFHRVQNNPAAHHAYVFPFKFYCAARCSCCTTPPTREAFRVEEGQGKTRQVCLCV
jgi:hypothetical protein